MKFVGGLPTVEVTCPACGNTWALPVRRHNKIGQGVHYAKEMTRLDEESKECLQALDEASATDWEHGLTRTDVTFKVNEIRKRAGKPNIKVGSVSHSLSVLQGLGTLSCKPVETIMTDPDTKRFEHTGKPRWYRVSRSLLEDR